MLGVEPAPVETRVEYRIHCSLRPGPRFDGVAAGGQGKRTPGPSAYAAPAIDASKDDRRTNEAIPMN